MFFTIYDILKEREILKIISSFTFNFRVTCFSLNMIKSKFTIHKYFHVKTSKNKWTNDLV